MGNLVDALRRHRLVGFDPPIFVYHIEQTPRRAIPAGSVLRALADGQFAGVTSVLTLLELAIKPIRIGRPEVADAYEMLVQDIDNLAVVGIDTRVSRIGAELRAGYGWPTPDALQIAACLAHGATVFVNNDRRLRRVEEIEVLLLDEVVAE
jgi:predicted nucleic acid-binding protein